MFLSGKKNRIAKFVDNIIFTQRRSEVSEERKAFHRR
jgi:hypothetical protein